MLGRCGADDADGTAARAKANVNSRTCVALGPHSQSRAHSITEGTRRIQTLGHACPSQLVRNRNAHKACPTARLLVWHTTRVTALPQRAVNMACAAVRIAR